MKKKSFTKKTKPLSVIMAEKFLDGDKTISLRAIDAQVTFEALKSNAIRLFAYKNYLYYIILIGLIYGLLNIH